MSEALPAVLHEALDTWSFNVMLECTREDDQLEMVIGGAVLDLRDLDRILTWAMGANGLTDGPTQALQEVER